MDRWNGQSRHRRIVEAKPIVFVIDDDKSVRNGLARLLRTVGYDIEVFGSGLDFLARAEHLGPVCVIVDVRMPGLDGFELQQALTLRRTGEQLIFLTGHGDIPMCVRALTAGAADFLTKPFCPDELLQCVKCAVARSAEQKRIAVEWKEAQHLLDSLSPRQFQVMQLVITGMLSKQIASRLGISLRTVKEHRMIAMQKLQITSVAELVGLIAKAERCRFSPVRGDPDEKCRR
jgi:FixJ family two-component response regulator